MLADLHHRFRVLVCFVYVTVGVNVRVTEWPTVKRSGKGVVTMTAAYATAWELFWKHRVFQQRYSQAEAANCVTLPAHCQHD